MTIMFGRTELAFNNHQPISRDTEFNSFHVIALSGLQIKRKFQNYHNNVLADAERGEDTLAVEETVGRQRIRSDDDAKGPIVRHVHYLRGIEAYWIKRRCITTNLTYEPKKWEKL